MVPILSVVGRTNSGKTTLMEHLIPELKRRGYRVGTVKHDVHTFDMDCPGKDTWRHAEAGADTVVISSPSRVACIKKVGEDTPLDSLAAAYLEDVDIIICEGYKRDNKPKIEVVRSEVGSQPICGRDDNLIALVTDVECDLGVPCLAPGEGGGAVADLVEEKFLGGSVPTVRK